ncbi:TatD family hydrolase [Sphaerochaeta sp.]|uniref:TatD family hydrolase n=1 Tax=Sphaerochaeta sp. TaxID=1972642 RepID=UPI003D0DB083
MFDAHRHFSSAKACANALYATSKTGEWGRLKGMHHPSVGGIGALPEKPLPTAELLYEYVSKQADLQIAEVGLDRRWPDAEAQQLFLLEVLDIAYILERSVSLHCVRRDGLLLGLLKRQGKHLPTLLWHGCTLSWESAHQASRMGIILSFAPSLYTSALAREGKRLVTLRYALETDYALEMEEPYEAYLEKHLDAFSELTDTSCDTLIRNNDEIRAILTNQPSAR